MANIIDRIREAEGEYVWWQRRWVQATGVVLLIAVVAQFCAVRSGDSHNVAQDVRIEDCRLLQDGQLEATGIAYNHGSGTKDYDIRVKFVVNGNDFGDDSTTVRKLKSDQARRWRIRIDAASTGALQCEIVDIDRH